MVALCLGGLLGACSSSGDPPCDPGGAASAALAVEAVGGCTLDQEYTFSHDPRLPQFICQRTPTELRLMQWAADGGGAVTWAFTLGAYLGPGSYHFDATTTDATLSLMFQSGVVNCPSESPDVWLNPTVADSSCDLEIAEECESGGGDAGASRIRITGSLTCTLLYELAPEATFTVTGTFDLTGCLGT